MSSYTIYYSNTSDSPPIGESRTITTRNLEEAIVFAEQDCPPHAHQPSTGDVRGFCICDADHKLVVSWREVRAEAQAW